VPFCFFTCKKGKNNGPKSLRKKSLMFFEKGQGFFKKSLTFFQQGQTFFQNHFFALKFGVERVGDFSCFLSLEKLFLSSEKHSLSLEKHFLSSEKHSSPLEKHSLSFEKHSLSLNKAFFTFESRFYPLL
jgi:hypothetical protein